MPASNPVVVQEHSETPVPTSMTNPFSRGSEWRKWDLHLHTPGTAKADNYSDDINVWESFLTELEALSDIAVFGITDYWSIDNWKKLKDEQSNNHRLRGKLLIPNVELRIIPVTKKDIPINLHVLFDPKMSFDDIQRQFFQQLHFERCGAKFSATKNDLVALGRQICGDSGLPEIAAWRKGVEQFQVPYTKIKELVESPYWCGKCIVGVANGTNDGASGIQDCAMRESRCEIYRMADFVFSARKQDIDFFLGRDRDSEERVIEQCGSIKPCVFGSDAHDFTRLKTWHTGKVTWVKADPTFEGLKQILFEPAERVRIQESKPEAKPPYQIIDSITVSEEGFWEQTIPLNPNLVTIIGGRSSGKSTLLSCIAEKIGHSQEYSDPEDTVREKGYIEEHNKSLSVVWADNGAAQDHKVDFFCQNYMIHLQSDRKEVDKLIAKIIKSIPENAKRFSKYNQFLIDTKSEITNDCALLFSQREKIDNLDLEIKEKGGLDGHAKEVKALSMQLEEKKKQHSNLTEQEQSEFDSIRESVEHSKDRLSILNRDKSAIDILIEKEKTTVAPQLDITRISDEQGLLLMETFSSLWREFHEKWLSSLMEFRDKLLSEINKIAETLQEFSSRDVYKKGEEDLRANSTLKDLEQRLANEKTKYNEIAGLVQQRKKLQNDNRQLIRSLSEKHCSFLEQANQFVADIVWANEDLKIKGSVSVTKQELTERLEGQITRKSKAQQELFDSLIQHNDFDVAKTSSFLEDVMTKRISYNQGVDEQYLVSEFLSSNWFEINYDIVYQGDIFSAMSPGKRAFVILRLLLEFGNNECPILIDQPEDSLDNRAIFTELVQYLRDKKKQRQIILVTHNPNVVVGADAEQVIVANQTGVKNENINGRKFAYISGALENSRPKDSSCATVLESQGIREHVCEILEGGEDAFKKRESKYGFSL